MQKIFGVGLIGSNKQWRVNDPMSIKEFDVLYQRASEVVKYRNPNIPTRTVRVSATSKAAALEAASEVFGRVVLSASLVRDPWPLTPYRPVKWPKRALQKAPKKRAAVAVEKDTWANQPTSSYTPPIFPEAVPFYEDEQEAVPYSDAGKQKEWNATQLSDDFPTAAGSEEPVEGATETKRNLRNKSIRAVVTVLTVLAVFLGLQYKTGDWTISLGSAFVVALVMCYFIAVPATRLFTFVASLHQHKARLSI